MGDAGRNRVQVLLLDKSTLALRQLQRLLSEFRKCDVLTFDSVRTALQSISRQKPDLIITEWELSDLTAAELLQALHARGDWEKIPVILCTSNRSQKLRIQAQKLGVLDVLHKPIEPKILKLHLKQLFPRASSLEKRPDDEKKESIRSRISRIHTLAPLPALAKSIIDISDDPGSSVRNLADVVKMDQSLTAKILKIVNSAYYGFHREIGNVDHAIVVLGFDEIRNITLAACLIRSFQSSKNHLFSRSKFWLHSLGAAYVARALCNYKPEIFPKDAFVMGLLHDFGKVVLHQHFTDIFYKALQMAAEREQPLYQVSEELMEIDHAEIGGMVAESWNLPISLVKAIRYHHKPAGAYGHEEEIHLTHLANYFCHRFGIGDSGNPVLEEPFIGSLKAFGFEEQDLGDVWTNLNIDVQSLSEFI